MNKPVKPPGLRQRKKEQRRREIMLRGKELFTEHGYASVMFDDIARLADVSVGTVYNYFPSKSELLFCIFESEALDLAAVIDESIEYPSIQDEIVDIFRKAFAAIGHIEPQLWRHVVAEMLLAPEAYVKRWLVVEDHLTAQIGKAIARRHDTQDMVWAGETMSPDELGKVFYALGKAGFYAYIGISHHDKNRAVETLLSHISLLAELLFGKREQT
jgi:AcrR family transcriptional regulator